MVLYRADQRETRDGLKEHWLDIGTPIRGDHIKTVDARSDVIPQRLVECNAEHCRPFMLYQQAP